MGVGREQGKQKPQGDEALSEGASQKGREERGAGNRDGLKSYRLLALLLLKSLDKAHRIISPLSSESS